MELVVIQYKKGGCYRESMPFQKVVNPYYPADIFARFRVYSDTCGIVLKVYKDYWNIDNKGLICKMWVPFCMTDFLRCYRTKPYIYLLVSFCGRRLVFDFLRGDYQSQLLEEKRIKQDVDDQPCRVFRREDIPDEARYLCDFTPLDGIDV